MIQAKWFQGEPNSNNDVPKFKTSQYPLWFTPPNYTLNHNNLNKPKKSKLNHLVFNSCTTQGSHCRIMFDSSMKTWSAKSENENTKVQTRNLKICSKLFSHVLLSITCVV